MRQRLGSRAYAVASEFLLMDEPFGALDAQTRTAMQDLLLQVLQAEGKTVMLITHSVDEAIYLSSRIVVVTARPARVRTVIDVPFGYPRDGRLQENPQFAHLRTEIRELGMQEARRRHARLRRRRQHRRLIPGHAVHPDPLRSHHDPSPQNLIQAGHGIAGRLRQRAAKTSRNCAWATCTPRRWTARSSSVSRWAALPSTGSTWNCASSPPGSNCSRP
jgi:hypothetical protein